MTLGSVQGKSEVAPPSKGGEGRFPQQRSSDCVPRIPSNPGTDVLLVLRDLLRKAELGSKVQGSLDGSQPFQVSTRMALRVSLWQGHLRGSHKDTQGLPSPSSALHPWEPSQLSIRVCPQADLAWLFVVTQLVNLRWVAP